jgi:hypothetical protein
MQHFFITLLLTPHLQASQGEAQRRLEQARQLSAGCVSLLEALSGMSAWPLESAWLVLRPVLRLLLWLLPEHAPCRQQQPSSKAEGTDLAAQSTGSSTVPKRMAPRNDGAAATAIDGGQQIERTRSYVSAVATVSIVPVVRSTTVPSK